MRKQNGEELLQDQGFSKKFLNRFWKKVKITDSCWEWTATKVGGGYGHINFSKGEVIRAHRVSWIFFNGPIPKGMHVLHKCDNPPCVRPDHLFLGTPKMNALDRVEKGRGNKGEKNGQCKLNESDVLKIRELYSIGVHTYASIAKIFSCGVVTVADIIVRKCWKHI